MHRGCLDRLTLTAVASERCPPDSFRHVRRHLAACPRCRARLVRAAQGQLGDTADGQPAPARRPPWALPSAALTLAAALVAWCHQHPGETPAPAIAAALRLSERAPPSNEGAHRETPAETPASSLERSRAEPVAADAARSNDGRRAEPAAAPPGAPCARVGQAAPTLAAPTLAAPALPASSLTPLVSPELAAPAFARPPGAVLRHHRRLAAELPPVAGGPELAIPSERIEPSESTTPLGVLADGRRVRLTLE